jgi:hypothetical protein
MLQGSIFSVVRFPVELKLTEDFVLLSSKICSSFLTLSVTLGKHLRLVIQDEKNATILYYTTQPIKVLGEGSMLVAIIWAGQKANIWINGVELKHGTDVPFEFIEINTQREKLDESLLSFDHPDAKAKCQGRINQRKNLILKDNLNGRLKSIEEQVGELKNSIFFLEDAVNRISCGQRHYYSKLAVELRALICLGKDYKPLLLRLAALYEMPLPIFSLPKDKDIPDCIKKADSHYKSYDINIYKKYHNHELMDFQDWLDFDCIIINPNKLDEKIKHRKNREVISDIANTFGAHYDNLVPPVVDLIDQMRMGDTNVLISFLIETANIVIELGKYVLKK